jgi:hypothetical protein
MASSGGTWLSSVWSASWPTLLVAVIFSGGIAAGRFSVSLPEKRRIAIWEESESLGRLVQDPEARRSTALAYSDPERAAREMDEYSWSVRTIPTPFVGHAPVPGKQLNASINQLQIRSSEIATPKPPGVYRVFLTGGSTAYSSGAPSQNETIAGFLRIELQRVLEQKGLKVEVHTAATPGWASTQERIFIENRLSELEPDLVISFSGNNDAHWGFLGRDVLWFRSYADQLHFELLDGVYQRTGYGPLHDSAPKGDPILVELVASRLEKNVKLAANALRLHGARYVFALQPTISVGTKALTTRERELLAKYPDKAKYFAEAYGAIRSRLGNVSEPNFHFLDLSDPFPGSAEEIFIDSYHFGDRGNRLIAEKIFRLLSEMGLLEPVYKSRAELAAP